MTRRRNSPSPDQLDGPSAGRVRRLLVLFLASSLVLAGLATFAPITADAAAPTGSPYGNLESLTQVTGGISIAGWGLDPDTTDPIRIDVYADGVGLGSTTATIARPDIAAAFGLGANHGFNATFGLGPGLHTVCAYGINVGPGANWALGCKNITIDFNPRGNLESLTQVTGGISIAGWGLDPDTTDPIRIDVYADGVGLGSTTANIARPDIAAAFGLGANHGFNATFGLGPGLHTVCAYGINVGPGANWALGCKNITINFNPRGNLESLTQVNGGITLSGWGLDPDTTDPIRIDVYADGVGLGSTTANIARPDIAAAFGLGANHGFNATFGLGQGLHTVCVYGINVGPGANWALGCENINLDFSPRGNLESLSQVSGGISLSGWGLQPYSTDSITVAISADGVALGSTTANIARPDIAAAFGLGANHGFNATLATPNLSSGTHTICATATNTAAGANGTLGCRRITLAFNPYGNLESLTQVSGGITLSGWGLDPDTTGPIRIDVYADGVGIGSTTANIARPDIAAAFGLGANHGFNATLGLGQGLHTVCVYGINVGPGANWALGCQNITINFNPVGNLESVVRSSDTTISVGGWAFDPDAVAPISVSVSIDGTASTVLANGSRPDVATSYPKAGPTSGFSTTLTTTSGEHTICVTALNVGPGTDQSLGCIIVNAVHPVLPGVPQNVLASAGYGVATVNWAAPSSDGGAPVNYRITAYPSNISVYAPLGATSALVFGLASSTAYTFTVTAINIVGASPPVGSNYTTTQAAPPPQTTVAPISTSRYIRNITGAPSDTATMYAEGAADGAANATGHGYIALLDIGGQTQSRGGVLLSAIARYISYPALVTALDSYVDGYASAQQPSAPVIIALGTNNDSDVNAQTGTDWATRVVNQVQAHALGYGGITIAGADDIEPGFSNGVAATQTWLAGYLAATSAPFVFNGSADGCSWTAINGSCNNGWTAAALYGLSGGAAPTRIISLPQIYNTTMAAQWKYISLTGVAAGQPRINFGGALTELTACQQAGSCSSLYGNSAWNALWAQLNSDARLKPSSLPYSTDLRIN